MVRPSSKSSLFLQKHVLLGNSLSPVAARFAFKLKNNSRTHVSAAAYYVEKVDHSDRVTTPRNATGRTCASRVAGVAVHNAIAADHRAPHIKTVARAAGTNRRRRACADADRAENSDRESCDAKTRNEFLHMTPLEQGSDRKPHTRVMRCGEQYTGKWGSVQVQMYCLMTSTHAIV